MRILITDKISPLFIDLLEKHNIDYEYNFSDSWSQFGTKIHEFDGIVVRNRLVIDKNFLEHAKNLKFIARYGSGMELIDTQFAEKLNIKCFNSAAGNANSVAEHNLGMLLALFHKITHSMKQLNNLIWEREGNRGIEVEGKTIAIIGYGNTGKAFSQKLKSFNCKTLIYDKYKSRFGNDDVIESNMNEIYDKSDVISFHIPLNQENTNIFNREFIAKMRKPFYILNTSRGRIVNNTDLIWGLKEKKILGAGLDVIENENKTFNSVNIDQNFNYLVNCENVILTPHIAGLSKDAHKKLSEILINKIIQLK